MNDLLFAQVAGSEGPSPFGALVPLAAVILIFYFLLIRPQQKREQEKESYRNALKKGDEIVTVGGLHGRVADLRGSVVVLDLAPNVRVRVERRSVEGPAPSAGTEKEPGR